MYEIVQYFTSALWQALRQNNHRRVFESYPVRAPISLSELTQDAPEGKTQGVRQWPYLEPACIVTHFVTQLPSKARL